MCNFLNLATLGGFTRVFRENRHLLVFGGVWALGEISGPNRPKKRDPKKVEKHVESFSPQFQKICIVKNRVIFSRFRPLVHPIGAVRTEKTQPFSGPKKIRTRKKSKNMLKILFFVAVSKNVFASKTERFSRFFFVFGPWCPLLGVRTEKT